MHCLTRVRALKSYTVGRKNDFHQNRNSTASLCFEKGMSQNSELIFNFSDSKNLVRAELIEGNKVIYSFENEEPPSVRVRSPLPDKDKIIETALYWVENDSNFPTLESWLGFFEYSRQKEIFDEIQEIRKSLKRIKLKTESIKIVKDAYSKHRLNKT
jgi:hypothetical protein